MTDEKSYLKKRLDELNTTKQSLEDDLKALATANNSSTSDGMSNEQQEKFDKMKKKLNDTLEQVGYMKSQLEYKDNEMVELKSKADEKEGEMLELKEELDRKGMFVKVFYILLICLYVFHLTSHTYITPPLRT